MKPNWKDAPEWANYIAMDGDAELWWYENEPKPDDNFEHWVPDGGRTQRFYGQLNWRDSLEQRHKDERMSHKKFSGKIEVVSNDAPTTVDFVLIEDLYKDFKARMLEEMSADKANDNVIKFYTDITIPNDTLVEVCDVVTEYWSAGIPRGGRLVSVTLEFAED